MRYLPLVIILLPLQALPAYAYIGPGLSGGVLATVLGVLAAIFLALFAIVWYPIKRLIKRLRRKRD
jgi:uncharacterized membrane protein